MTSAGPVSGDRATRSIGHPVTPDVRSLTATPTAAATIPAPARPGPLGALRVSGAGSARTIGAAIAGAEPGRTSGGGPGGGHADAGQDQPNPGAPLSTPTSATATPTTGGSPAAAVPLSRAGEALSATLTAMHSHGVSVARISLAPASLGGIRITLTQTTAGLVARVSADHPEAAQALLQSAEELRRGLEAGGTPLLRFDVSHSGQPDPGNAGGGTAGGGTTPRHPESPQGHAATADGEEPSGAPLTVTLSDGALVNVLV